MLQPHRDTNVRSSSPHKSRCHWPDGLRRRNQKMALEHWPNATLTYFTAVFALRRVRTGFAVGVTGFACGG